ncbi:aspartate/glutamate racemase family protein [Caldovatus aquaticus]|uniref:Aspartate/glutamate racemase family protein n=1 Tax=Caldovatus aquaticus TaxID=2865671 RepID=A0ABS7F013_9PROT|nr:aspartate/glutamate racemase family protein [Caldovatus aquaticus]MBW8268967.1 aspartate/glutamate racemase family protein [Caldovatus aquaticus]
MKLLLLNGNTDPAITGLLMARAAAALPRLGLGGATLVPETARFGARYVASRAAAAIAAHAVLERIAERIGPANPDRFAGVLLACFGDPGLEAARELCPVPVVGMAEASLAAALRVAGNRPVAVLTGGAAWVPMLEEFARLRGLGPERVRVRSVPPAGDAIARAPERALAMLAEAAREAAEGAGAVVLGGAGLAGLAERIAPRLPGVPLLDSLDCLLAEGVTAARRPADGTPPRPAPVATTGLSPALARALGAGAPGGTPARQGPAAG